MTAEPVRALALALVAGFAALASPVHARVSIDRLGGQVSDDDVRARDLLLSRLGIRAVAAPTLQRGAPVLPQPRTGELERPQPV